MIFSHAKIIVFNQSSMLVNMNILCCYRKDCHLYNKQENLSTRFRVFLVLNIAYLTGSKSGISAHVIFSIYLIFDEFHVFHNDFSGENLISIHNYAAESVSICTYLPPSTKLMNTVNSDSRFQPTLHANVPNYVQEFASSL